MTSPVAPGQILAGKYRVDRVLGIGGMGVVVAATHLQLDERVAIKFLLPEALESRDTVARFAREARAAVKIKNEHVARVSDVGTLDDGSPYMVMEYLDGSDLSAVIAERGALPVADAVDYLLQGMEAIAEAHSLGIIHRDIKPSNLFLTRSSDGRALVKVLDFGISKVDSRGAMTEAALTRTSSIMGSPLYMAPEQMVSTREVDARADVWALGIVLYELLARHAPFLGESMTELCARILQEPPAPLRLSRPDISPDLESVILRALQKDRSHRYASVADFATSLAPFAPAHAQLSIERIVRLVGGDSGPASYAATALGVGIQPHAQITPLLTQSPIAPIAPAGFATPPPFRAPQFAQGGSTQSSWGHTRGDKSQNLRWLWVGIIAIGAVGAGILFGVGALIVHSKSNAAATGDVTTATALATTTAKPHATDDSTSVSPLGTLSDPTAPTTTPHGTGRPLPSARPSATGALTAPLSTLSPTATATTPPTATTSKRPDIF
ncbi:hypothetical protein BH09MYX1_BH09MYX1_44180 [soil metagenome]